MHHNQSLIPTIFFFFVAVPTTAFFYLLGHVLEGVLEVFLAEGKLADSPDFSVLNNR